VFESFFSLSRVPFPRDIPTQELYKSTVLEETQFYRGDSNRQLHEEIELTQVVHHQQPVVVVDDAHLLDKEMLEEVRFLLNTNMDAQSPMILILVGQTELWNRLKIQSYATIC
jgi:hypothetical protein